MVKRIEDSQAVKHCSYILMYSERFLSSIFILMFSAILSEELSRGNSLEVFQLGMSGAGMLGRVYCDDYGGSCGGIFGMNVAMVTY